MKLGELEPSLDPRKPLRFAGLHAAGNGAGSGEPVWRQHLSPLQLAAADLVDFGDVDRATGIVAQQAARLGRSPESWRQEAMRLHGRAELGTIRTRAQQLTALFTGASTGVLVALWHQESDQLRLQLHEYFISQSDQLQALRAEAADAAVADLAPLRTKLDLVRSAWLQLNQFDLLDRAFNANNVLALSPAANAAISGSAVVPVASLEGAFQRRSDWQAGVVWSPDRNALVCWCVEDQQTHLFEVDAGQLTIWIGSLQSGTPSILTWRYSLLPPNARLTQNAGWASAATQLTRLLGLGQVANRAGAKIDPRSAARLALAGRRTTATVPTTRYVITAQESRQGVQPFILGTGNPPADRDWVPARFRNTWNAEQGRYVRVWTDAHPKGRQPPNVPILLTVLP